MKCDLKNPSKKSDYVYQDFERVIKKELVENIYTKNSFKENFKNELLNNKPAIFCMILMIIIIIATMLASFSPYDPNQIQSGQRLQTASVEHIFGTDTFGRDVFTRILYGGRVSLTVGFASMVFTVILGTSIGVIAGYCGGKIDELLMRFTDIFLALPSMLLMIILNTFLKPSLTTLIMVLSLFSWAEVARITRAETMSLKERDFIRATKNLGASTWRIAIFHILPNIVGPITVAASLGIAKAILSESSLSYLGLGVQIPQSSWGSMLQDAQAHMLDTPMLAVYPGLCIFITVLSFNLLGDVLRSSFETKSKK